MGLCPNRLDDPAVGLFGTNFNSNLFAFRFENLPKFWTALRNLIFSIFKILFDQKLNLRFSHKQ